MKKMNRILGMILCLVLALSLSYIPLERIGYSVLTVVISGQVIGLVQKIPLPKRCRKLPS